MKINTNSKLSEIQKEFNDSYPGLKLEFYSKEHKDHAGSPKSVQIDEDLIVTDLNENLQEGLLNIEESKRVSDIEQEFEDKFGLYVQVFRRSKELWLQTVTTDHWDLKTQNSKGIHSTEN